ncbi:OmpA family protein [Kineobactrum salinum]|uniref:OmpA family protein n=1 Tax=Kineobactrum salinum TaxID=2708301 RepID=A0A6C0U4Q3_9GAMM|nr:OmpA family protein [Kineobactrum salinum]QIB67081.1 OmpA family protein [Kineobactrum salinum]
MHPGKALLLVVVAVFVSGCATRSYVDERLARLEARQDVQESRIEELTSTSSQALERATDAGRLAQGKFLYSVVFADDGFTFDSNNSALSSTMQARLTELASDLKADNRNVYLEIQGHTDSTGPAAYNQQLGLQRAEAVRRYLHTQGVALDRMATISYGEDEPAASNDTTEGRAMNRRVVVVVLT